MSNKRRLFDIGAMRDRIEVHVVTRTDDGAGGFERADPSGATLLNKFWSKLEPVSARERQWSEQFTEVITHACWLRYNRLVTHGMIVIFKGEEFYVESAFDPDRRMEFLLLALRKGGPM